MLRILLTLLISFLIVSCNSMTTEKVSIHGTQTEVCTVVLHRARSPTEKVVRLIQIRDRSGIEYYLSSRNFGVSEGSQIETCGVEPHQRASISKNRRDFNFT